MKNMYTKFAGCLLLLCVFGVQQAKADSVFEVIGSMTIPGNSANPGVGETIKHDISPARIWAMSEAIKRTAGLDCVVVDYDQLVIEAGMDPKSDDDSIFRHQRAFIFEAKKLAERLNLCFVFLSQLRKLSSAVLKGSQPHVDDIWGDSSVRNTPHKILWLSREFFVKGQDPEFERPAKVYVLKNRSGRTGIVDLEFDPKRLRFLDAQRIESDTSERMI